MLFGKQINRYYLRYGYALLLGILSLVMVDYIQLEIPELYRQVINGINNGFVNRDGVSVPFDMTFLLDSVCRPMIGIIVLMVFGRFLWRICLFGSAIKMETDLRRRMFAHSRFLSQQYYQENKVGALMTLYTNDLETVQDCFGSGVLMLFDALCLGLMALWKMRNMNVILTLLALIPLCLLLVASLILGKYLTARWEKRQESFSSLSDYAQESFSGIAVIKAFVKESLELSSFRRLNRNNEDANVYYTRLSVLLNVSVTLMVESVVCVILGYGGYLVWKGIFDAGQPVEFIGYFTATVWPVMAVSEMIEMYSKGKASLGRISALLEAEPDVADRPGLEPAGTLQGGIEVRHLTFRYPGGDRDVLRDVSFTVKPGENVGIIGRTGAGKTTLVDLLLRTYNVPDGTVFLDGKDINAIPIHDVRQNAAYVPQDNFLFSDTIRNNIAFAADAVEEGASPDGETRSLEAAKLSDIYEDVAAFPNGFDTVLGERGVTVSGGQKQRISIARALYRDAPILILDDAVSAVDVSTEKTILHNLSVARAGKTTLLIAHRVSTIEGMDKILFLDDGRLVASGTHRELYETCPEYRRTVELQRLEAGEERHVRRSHRAEEVNPYV